MRESLDAIRLRKNTFFDKCNNVKKQELLLIKKKNHEENKNRQATCEKVGSYGL